MSKEAVAARFRQASGLNPVAIPLTGAVAAVLAYSGAAEAGESHEKASKNAGFAAAKASVPAAVIGSVAMFAAQHSGKVAATMALAGKALPFVAAISAVWGGIKGYKQTGTVLGTAAGAADGVIPQSGRLLEKAFAGKIASPTVATAAASTASTEMATTQHPSLPNGGTAPPPVSDGMVDPYTAVRGGKVVHVGGYARK